MNANVPPSPHFGRTDRRQFDVRSFVLDRRQTDASLNVMLCGTRGSGSCLKLSESGRSSNIFFDRSERKTGKNANLSENPSERTLCSTRASEDFSHKFCVGDRGHEIGVASIFDTNIDVLRASSNTMASRGTECQLMLSRGKLDS